VSTAREQKRAAGDERYHRVVGEAMNRSVVGLAVFGAVLVAGTWLALSVSRGRGAVERAAIVPVPTASAEAPRSTREPVSAAPPSKPATRETTVVEPEVPRAIEVEPAPALPSTLSGRVVDDRGVAVNGCRVSASLLVRRSNGRVDPVDTGIWTVALDDGRFQLDAFAPGTWELTATGEGHAPSAKLRVALPCSEPRVIVLPREARVLGVVVDPEGAPVPGARIAVTQDALVAIDAKDDDPMTSELGEFELSGLKGMVVMLARAEGWASSAALVLDVAPGAVREDIVLHLRAPCRITGEVHDRTGAAAKAYVYVDIERYRQTQQTDGRSFVVSGVPPGRIRVGAQTGEFSVERYVELGAGETTHVVLAPPTEGIRMHGRVLLDGEPVKASVSMDRVAEGGGTASATCDEEGEYELLLEGPGLHRIAVMGAEFPFGFWTLLDIPAVDDFDFDVAGESGRISGHVRDDEGRPVAGMVVEAESGHRLGASGSYRYAVTDADGRYEITVVAARHQVRAGGRSWQTAADGPTFGRTRVEDVVVRAGASVSEVDLVLHRGGALRGVVSPAEDARGARIRIAPATASEDVRTIGSTDDGGSFRIQGLEPGTWFVAATSGEKLSPWTRVEIEPGAERELELGLEPATSLLVRVVATDGTAWKARVHVLEANGRSHEAYHEMSDRSDPLRAGPFRPGTYRVRAEIDGRSAERTVEIAAGAEQLEVELEIE